MRVLVVEDDADLKNYIGEVLHSFGYEPVLCSDAETALNYCEKEFFPLVILDLSLPGMDGSELCRRIRKLVNGDDYYIIINSSRSSHEEIKELLDGGADDYCIKPFTSEDMQIRLMVAERNIVVRQYPRTSEQKLQYLATHDSLTGLGNRHQFY